ncbi:MAG TPA: LLM class flavin-dependent oxidoreductase [Ktedonobacteraceae bacterium]|nr:LLM class flavin-dependent oxidoreductase [Ktedonobacteraceae bacterium]
MQFGLDIPTSGDYADARTLAQLAAEAEQAGWDGFFIWDCLSLPAERHDDTQAFITALTTPGEQAPILLANEPLIEPWMALAAIAMSTQCIKIGAMVTPLSRRRPWQVARQTVALDHLSNGRLIFAAGLGFQDVDFTPFGEKYDAKIRAERLDEGLEILNGLWSGEPFSFHGKHYQVDNVTFLPRPVQQPRIPVWTAGGWPRRKPFRRAARWDGVYVMTYHQTENRPLTPGEVHEIVAYIQAMRTSPVPCEVAVNGITNGNTHEDSEIVRPYAEAGATWWIEYAAERETFAEYRQRILQGPPRV